MMGSENGHFIGDNGHRLVMPLRWHLRWENEIIDDSIFYSPGHRK